MIYSKLQGVERQEHNFASIRETCRSLRITDFPSAVWGSRGMFLYPRGKSTRAEMSLKSSTCLSIKEHLGCESHQPGQGMIYKMIGGWEVEEQVYIFLNVVSRDDRLHSFD
ncbi:hypothetical protein CDAR_289421 [Caerostris darwini]|uniref:Uncharacterized protein n=1 Tax=Caerostris darwini TaxID=1538125 RepID=A0AAV4WAH0_9ARAC|nr:hypothetical protein CDAR_289421 [Caerostris darwini]